MVLELEEIKVECIIGDLEAEREKKQLIFVDAELEIEEKASETDDISGTVDYCRIIDKAREALEKGKFRMLERAANAVCDACLSFEKVESVKAKVKKEGISKGVKSVSASMEKRRG